MYIIYNQIGNPLGFLVHESDALEFVNKSNCTYNVVRGESCMAPQSDIEAVWVKFDKFGDPISYSITERINYKIIYNIHNA